MSDNENENKPGFGESLKEAIRYMGPALAASLSSKDPMASYNAYTEAMAQKQKNEQLQMNQQAIIQRQQATSNNVSLQLEKMLLREKEVALKEKAESRRIKGFDLKQAQAGQLSGKQVGQLAAFNDTLTSIEMIKSMQPNVQTGPIMGNYRVFAQKLGIDAPKDFQAMQSLTSSLLSNYTKSISGAQVSEMEAQRLAALIPQPTDTKKMFNTKLITFQRIVNAGGANFVEAIKKGQPLKREQVDQILGAIPNSQTFGQQTQRVDAILTRFGNLDKGN
tara:strand:- start:1113 stop:1943 length:831 start_codon:yes stop_codon:yes gene_type:complete